MSHFIHINLKEVGQSESPGKCGNLLKDKFYSLTE